MRTSAGEEARRRPVLVLRGMQCSALASSDGARDRQGGAVLSLRGAVAARPDIEARRGAATLHIFVGEEVRWRPVQALRNGSGGTPGSGLGSSVTQQDLLAEKRSGARNAVADVKKLRA
jgi:hypothetical protein